MLELAILGLLKEGPMHGYDLRKRLRENFGPLANLSFGSLYPALARLEAGGAVRTVVNMPRGESGSNAPLTGSLGGERAALVARRATAKAAAALGGRGTRARKVYEIADRGEELFEQLLEEPTSIQGEDTGGFSLRLAFARHLTPQARVRLLERRSIQLADRLERTTRKLDRPDRPLDAYERAIAEHTREIAQSDLIWIDQLLATERTALIEQRHATDHEVPKHGSPAHRKPLPAGAGTTSNQGRNDG